jgi:hypothetical protein
MARVLRNHNNDRNTVSDSLIRIEIITHFHRNPGLEGTALELAQSIGRDVCRVEGQMKKLVQLNILDERVLGSQFYYHYIPPHYVSRRRQRGGKSGAAERTIHSIKQATAGGMHEQYRAE